MLKDHPSNLSGLVARLALAGLFLTVGLTVTMAAPGDDEAGFKPLFNGKDLSGWQGDTNLWSVQDGAITGQTTAEKKINGKSNTFLIWREGEVDDFVLRLSYKIVGGNSGIQYRSVELEKAHEGVKQPFVIGGYQGDFEAGDKFSGILYEEQLGRGILAERGNKVVIDDKGKKNVVEKLGDSAEIQKSIKKEDWNDYEIIAQGNHLIHKINGRVTIDVTDNDAAHRRMWGLLALQIHQGPPMKVQFKNIRLKRTKLTAGAKKIVMIAGHPSHGPGDHEFNAGVKILRSCLNSVPGIIATDYHDNGWPKDPTAFDNADAILMYMDGGSGHPAIQGDHLHLLQDLMKKGVGLACVHYAVEIPKDRGGPEFLDWIGGYYETGYSINPHWTANFASLPAHPITSGVKPFSINDEWYFNMRFPLQPKYVSILQATPPDDKRGTPAAKEHPGRSEVLAWAVERPDGGRGFGFTGGHFHRNWQDDNFRKLVLNALVWTAKGEIPKDGIASSVTAEQIAQNLDPKPQKPKKAPEAAKKAEAPKKVETPKVVEKPKAVEAPKMAEKPKTVAATPAAPEKVAPAAPETVAAQPTAPVAVAAASTNCNCCAPKVKVKHRRTCCR